MITKTKKAPKPKTAAEAEEGPRRMRPKTAGAARKAAALNEAPPLTELDREEAFELLWDRHPDLGPLLATTVGTAAAIDALGARLLNDGEPWKVVEAGLPKMVACEHGLAVQAADGMTRYAMFAWSEIVAEARRRWTWQDFKGASNGKAKSHPGHRGTTTPAGIAANAEGPMTNDDADRSRLSRPEPPATGGVLMRIELDRIAVTRDNPRKAFDQAALAELAASIAEHGLIEPLVARDMPAGDVELIAGERRLRAARMAKLDKVPCWIVTATAAQAREMRLVENLQREDLTAIEEAQAFADLIKLGGVDGAGRPRCTHAALAEKLGISEPQVTNRLRLLKLPKIWQDRILSRELPPTHARSLATYADCPAILEEADREFQSQYADEAFPLSLKLFDEHLRQIVEEKTEPMEGKTYSTTARNDVPIFTPTDAQRAELAIITVTTGQGKKQKREERATNTKLWNELQDASDRSRLSKIDQKGAAKKGAKKRSPAQEKTAAADAARQLAAWVQDWRSDWLRSILARYVIEDGTLALKTIVMGLAHGHQVQYASRSVDELVRSQTQHKGHAAICRAKPLEVLVQLAADWLWSEKQHESTVRTMPSGCVEALAESIHVDLAWHWKKDLAGDLTEPFFNRMPKATLITMARGLGFKTLLDGGPEAWKKTKLVAELIAAPALRTKLPKQIAPVSAVKKAVKKKKASGGR